jgi:hypothetical protein
MNVNLAVESLNGVEREFDCIDIDPAGMKYPIDIP